MRTDPNKSVFPFEFKLTDQHTAFGSGMTLREHYAGLAMQGLLQGHFSHYGHENYWDPHTIADHAIACADALIAELAKGGEA